MWENEDRAPLPRIRPKFTHYCPQCGDKYYGEQHCTHCGVKAVPIPADETTRRAA